MHSVLICGAGRVGQSIARFLANYDTHITIVDQDKDLVTHLSNTLDVRGIHGFASHPEVLLKAGAETADIFLAVTDHDEVNMVACEVAHAIFNVPTKIARIRSQMYLRPEYGLMFQDKNISIDGVLSPEIDVAEHILQSLSVPGANDVIAFGPPSRPTQNDASKKTPKNHIASLLSVSIRKTSPAAHTEIARLPRIMSEARLSILAITRDDRTFIPKETSLLLPGDTLFFVCHTEEVKTVMALFSPKKFHAQHIVICGGGNVGYSLAANIHKTFPDKEVTLIEQSQSRANYIAQSMTEINILCGNILDSDILTEANVQDADVFAVTDDYKVNALSILLAKNLGANSTQTLVHDPSYAHLVTSLGVDNAVLPDVITSSIILTHMRKKWVEKSFPIGGGVAECLEISIPPGAPIVGMSAQSLDNGRTISVAGLVRQNKLHLGKDYTIEPEDRLICFVTVEALKQFEKKCTAK